MRISFGFIFPFVAIAAQASAVNLVQNGDFSSGNTSFATNYDYHAPANDALFLANAYTVASSTVSPFLLNSFGIVDYHDHTSGSGSFFLANGSATFNSLVWQQTLTGLSIGQSYRFSTWVSRWTPNNESNGAVSAKLQALVDGLVLASFTDPSISGTWQEQGGFFTATSTSMTLQIRDLENGSFGNDFALDDINVQAVPEPTTFTLLGVGWLALRKRSAKRRL